MNYTFSTAFHGSFDEAVDATTEALQARGFGILSDIDVSATLKKKLGEDYPPYRILGACNPSMAFRALQAEPRIGAMLPCNVIVRETESGVEVSAVNPVASMQAVENARLAEIASQVRSMLEETIRDLAGRSEKQQ